MKKIQGKSANSYWLTLAGCYGLSIGVATMTALPWLFIVGGFFVVFPLIVGYFFGQVGRNVRYELFPERPAIAMTATGFAVVGMFLHGTPMAVWAGPLLGLATFIGTYFCLRRYGHFYRTVQDSPLDQEERASTR